MNVHRSYTMVTGEKWTQFQDIRTLGAYMETNAVTHVKIDGVWYKRMTLEEANELVDEHRNKVDSGD